ncbi:MAG: hypothetical protein C0448_16255 [Sphingobacteriaceae bacterium]|nr:hypothetical protein [Sphingobacteriaceae bacterium]
MKNISTLILLGLSILLPSTNTYADIKTGNSQATASINPACRVKVDNMSFGDVSMQSTSGNGDVFANSEISLLCTKDQSATITSNLGINSNGGSWVKGVDYVCQTAKGGFSATDGQLSGLWTIPTGQSLSDCYNYQLNQSGGTINSNKYYYGGAGGDWYRLARLDGSTIAVGSPPPPAQANMSNGSAKIPYSVSTNNVTYEPINTTAGNPLSYTQNNGDWQSFGLYFKANVKQAAPGVYIDTNTITVNF